MDVAVALVLAASAVATLYIWRRIARSGDPFPMKIALAVAVAIPVIGPLFWPFLSMPPRHTRSAIFKGPIAKTPDQPKWLAVSFRVLVVVAAVFVAAAHFMFFRELGK